MPIDCAFQGCSDLKDVTMGNGVTSIGKRAFRGALKSIVIPDNVNSIGYDAFSSLSLESITVSERNTKYASQDGILYNKEKTEFVHIPYNIKGSVTIPDSITSISDYTFEDRENLTGIVIPDSVTDIGEDAFQNCPIEKATMPALAISYIPKFNLKEVVITSGDRIEENAFCECSNLTNVIISDSVTSIGKRAFIYCSSLTNIVLSDKLTDIGDSAFWECRSLTNIVIPDSLNSIGREAFQGCPIEKATMPTLAIDYISKSDLKEVVITSGENIKERAFEWYSNLISVKICDGVISIGEYAFSCCTGLTSMVIPDSVTSIGNGAFNHCIGLETVTIGKGVTSINFYTFRQCTALTSITLGNGVKSINYAAFDDCSSLKKVFYNGTETEWRTIFIDGNPFLTDAKIYYYCESLPTDDGNYWRYVDGEIVVWAKED